MHLHTHACLPAAGSAEQPADESGASAEAAEDVVDAEFEEVKEDK